VSDSDRGNGGLVFDTWHFFRGSRDFELLEQIPGDRIFVVQFADAAKEVQGTLREDATRRLLPGDGCFDLPRVVRVLNAIGGLRAVGPEVISPTLAAMPAREAATLAASRVRDLVARAADM
jgi:sugar phosphate isomerase/epimerase